MATRLRAALLILGMMAALPAAALDYRSVAEPALLYDAPSQQGRPLFAIARGTPVETVVVLDAWVKVRDAKGDLTWIEKRLLSEKRMLIVKAERAQVRAQPEDPAPLVFEAERDVLVEYVELGPTGWVKVQHRGGQQGYVRIIQVWGL
jgi:SH3-like domain-containing protein